MTQKTKAQLATDLTTNFANNTSGSITPTVFRTFMTDVLDSLSAIPAARQTFAAAGGSAPNLYGLNAGALPDNSGTAFTLGTGAVQDSSWQVDGKEASWSVRLVAGTGASGTAADQWALGGFPTAPKMTTGHGRVIGSGFLLDSEDSYAPYDVLVVIDPFYSTTKPVLFYFVRQLATTDPAGLNSAAGTGAVTTDTPEVVATHLALAPVYIGAGTGICLTSTPFDFDDGCILNVSGSFETV